MSQAKFNKAVEIVQALPKDGPVKPSQDDQLYVSSCSDARTCRVAELRILVLQVFQAGSVMRCHYLVLSRLIVLLYL